MRTITEILADIEKAKQRIDRVHSSSELTPAINELSHLNFELSQAERFWEAQRELELDKI